MLSSRLGMGNGAVGALAVNGWLLGSSRHVLVGTLLANIRNVVVKGKQHTPDLYRNGVV